MLGCWRELLGVVMRGFPATEKEVKRVLEAVTKIVEVTDAGTGAVFIPGLKNFLEFLQGFESGLIPTHWASSICVVDFVMSREEKIDFLKHLADLRWVGIIPFFEKEKAVSFFSSKSDTLYMWLLSQLETPHDAVVPEDLMTEYVAVMSGSVSDKEESTSIN